MLNPEPVNDNAVNDNAVNANAANDNVVNAPDPQVYFQPLVQLPLVEVGQLDADEELVVQMRARIYRIDNDEEDGPEWKERGTGLLKILYNPKSRAYRIVMRRDVTFKICANHLLIPGMKLELHQDSDRAFVYSTTADLFDGEVSPQTFAIRFRNAEIASTFKSAFEECVEAASGKKSNDDEESDEESDEEDKENQSSKSKGRASDGKNSVDKKDKEADEEKKDSKNKDKAADDKDSSDKAADGKDSNDKADKEDKNDTEEKADEKVEELAEQFEKKVDI